MQEHIEVALEDDTDWPYKKCSFNILNPNPHPSISNSGQQESQLSWHKWIPLLNENVLPLIILSMQLQILRKKSYKCIH